MSMIEINLLSEEAKTKHKAQSAGPGPDSTPLLLLLLPLLLAALLAANVYFAVLGQVKAGNLNKLTRKWDGLAEQRKQVDEFNERYALDAVYGQEQQSLLSQRISWAQKLNILSLDLPSGIWLNEIAVTASSMMIRGSVVSLEKLEMSLIKALIDKLKSEPIFAQDFSSFELGTVQKKAVGNMDIVDFVLDCKIRAR